MPTAKPKVSKRPTKADKKKYQPLIDACTDICIKAPNRRIFVGCVGRYLHVRMTWPLKDGKLVDWPEGWPKHASFNISSTPTSKTALWNVEPIMRWFKVNGYTTYDASDIFAQRQGLLHSLSRFESRMEEFLEIKLADG